MEGAIFRCGDITLARELLAAARAAQARVTALLRERARLVRIALAELAPTLEAARQLASSTALALGKDSAAVGAVASANALAAQCLAARQALRHHQQFEIILAEHDAVVFRSQRMMASGRESKTHASERVLSRSEVACSDNNVVYAFDVFSHSCSLFLGVRDIIIVLASIAESRAVSEPSTCSRIL